MSEKKEVLVSIMRKELSSDEEPWGFSVPGTYLKGENCSYLIYEETRENFLKVKHRIKIEPDCVTVTEDMPSQHIEVIYSEKEDHESVVSESGLVIDIHTHTKRLVVDSSERFPVDVLIDFSTEYNRETGPAADDTPMEAELTIKAEKI